jgi:hypothetical protein
MQHSDIPDGRARFISRMRWPAMRRKHDALSPRADKFSPCFKWIGESIKSRAAMRIAQQTFVWSHLPLDLLGYPYMKLNVALAASIAALALMTACSKQEAASDAAAPAADAAAASADAAAASADAAASSADAAATAAPADGAAAPAADAAAAPAGDAAATPPPAEAPKQ